jgi:HEPN domain-containing protein
MMQPEDRSEARDWLVRAERDLMIARRAIQEAPVLPDQAAYHAQQAAETALKAFLSLSGTPFSKTHDLVLLASMGQEQAPGFDQFAAAAQLLTPYATQFRYPGSPIELEVAEA